MDLVKSMDEIRININTIDNYLAKADPEMEIAYKDYCKGLEIQVKGKGSFGVSGKY